MIRNRFDISATLSEITGIEAGILTDMSQLIADPKRTSVYATWVFRATDQSQRLWLRIFPDLNVLYMSKNNRKSDHPPIDKDEWVFYLLSMKTQNEKWSLKKRVDPHIMCHGLRVLHTWLEEAP